MWCHSNETIFEQIKLLVGNMSWFPGNDALWCYLFKWVFGQTRRAFSLENKSKRTEVYWPKANMIPANQRQSVYTASGPDLARVVTLSKRDRVSRTTKDWTVHDRQWVKLRVHKASEIYVNVILVLYISMLWITSHLLSRVFPFTERLQRTKL